MAEQKFGYAVAEGGLRFVRRRCMLQDVDRAGRKVGRWSGWYLIEAYDAYTGLPTGVYFAPPSYEDFAFVYSKKGEGVNKKDFDWWEDTLREASPDVDLNPVSQLVGGIAKNMSPVGL